MNDFKRDIEDDLQEVEDRIARLPDIPGSSTYIVAMRGAIQDLKENASAIQELLNRTYPMKEVGLDDINGFPIKTGDRVQGLEARYERIPGQLDSELPAGGIPVVEVDQSRPLAAPDVPLFTGRVEWCEVNLAFVVRIEEIHADWEAEPASVHLGGGHYFFQILDDE